MDMLRHFSGRRGANQAEMIEQLHEAIDRGDLEQCTMLATLRTVNAPFGTGFDHLLPLERAAKGGHLDICSLLLLSGAEVGAKNPVTQSTALWWACEHGHSDIVTLFKEHGVHADEDAESSGDYEFAGLDFDSEE